MKNLFFVFLLGISVISISSCGEDCESCNTTADFTISEGSFNLQDRNEWLQTDTIGTFYDVKFEAVCDDMTRYEWTIGTDDRTFTESSFTLYFATPTTLDVKLVVYKDEDPNCPDNIIRKDSITKRLTIVDNDDTYIEGVYKGYNTDNPNHEFEVEVRFDSTEALVGAYVIHNLPEGCNLKNSSSRAATIFPFRTRFYMDFNRNQPSCDTPKGWGRLKGDLNTLVIDYHIKNFDTDELIPYQFIGKRQ